MLDQQGNRLHMGQVYRTVALGQRNSASHPFSAGQGVLHDHCVALSLTAGGGDIRAGTVVAAALGVGISLIGGRLPAVVLQLIPSGKAVVVEVAEKKFAP